MAPTLQSLFCLGQEKTAPWLPGCAEAPHPLAPTQSGMVWEFLDLTILLREPHSPCPDIIISSLPSGGGRSLLFAFTHPPTPAQSRISKTISGCGSFYFLSQWGAGASPVLEAKNQDPFSQAFHCVPVP